MSNEATAKQPLRDAMLARVIKERNEAREEVGRLREALDFAETAMSAAIPYVPKDIEIALRERVTLARAALSGKKEGE